MAYSVGTAFVRIAPSFRGFQTSVGAGISTPLSQAGDKAGQTAGRRFTDRFKGALKIGAAVGGAMAAAAGGRFLKESIREASALGESLNAVNVTFGRNAAGIKRLGQDAANALGLSRSEFNGLAVQFSAFATTIAGKGGDVVGVMDDLTTRGADFASVMDLDVNEAMRLFQSGLAGETEPLRKFGIDLSAAAVEAHAVEKGIAAAGATMTEQQKVQARYSLLMAQTAKTQGDFANTSDSLANAQRRLGARWDDIQAQVGAKLIPALERLSGWVLDKGLPALQRFGGFIANDVVPAFKAMGEWVQRNSGWLLPLAAAIGTAVVVIKAITIATKVWAATQALLNAALAANPIGIVIVVLAALTAALVVAYKRSETFRAIVQKVWSAVQAAVEFAWERVIRPAFIAWKTYLDRVLFPVLRFLYERVVKPIFGHIGRSISIAWGVIKRAFQAWVTFFNRVLFPVIRFLWDRIVKPVFAGLARTIEGTWNRGIKPVFRSLGRGIGAVRDAFRRGVDAISRIWSALQRAAARPVNFVIDTVYNNGIRKVINALPGVDDLPRLGRIATSNYGSGAIRGVGRGPLIGLESGGTVAGQRAPYGDKVLRWLAPGEEVISNRRGQADRFRPLLKAINAGGMADGGTVLSDLGDLIKSAASGAWSTAKGLAGSVREWAGSLREQFGPWGRMLGQALRSVIGDVRSWVTDKITSMFRADGGGQATPNGLGGLGPAALRAAAFVRDHFGFNGTIGGYAYRTIAGTSQLSKHALGKAIDVMTYSNMALGQRIANYFASPEGRTRFGVDNVIWNRRITNAGRGWRWGYYSGVSPHTDHPHIDFYDNGGMLPKGLSLAYNGTGAAEHAGILTNQQWSDLHKVANGARASGPTVNYEHVHVTDLDALMRHQRRESHKARVLAGLPA